MARSTGSCRSGAGASPRAPIASATSPFVMRPPRPVPATLAGSTPLSAIILRAAGSAVTGSLAGGGVDADDAGLAGAEAVVGVGAAAALAAGAPAALALPSVSITAMTSFDVTVDPSGCLISASTPSPGAGNSRTTLSVSMSMRFSSRLTASPAFLCQLTSVASVIDSGNCGTFTSILIAPLPLSGSPREHHFARAQLRRECVLDQLLLLGHVLRRIADGR